ncbi:hypothetical protein BN59_02576 [Legionella massiliensis]|uniref:Uncharacterized protein n=1 Tax=Legionella massiliensis TaxID=1034943 RepID=A0A078KZB4_9GAMM|nr:hypothetical protein BN59_02576 [Legionella massiliensis]CEE14004.1 hypothetical protein BN1094_02576 [Legionella massiliensis]
MLRFFRILFVQPALKADLFMSSPFRHPERSEGSPGLAQCHIQEILRYAQDDGRGMTYYSYYECNLDGYNND